MRGPGLLRARSLAVLDAGSRAGRRRIAELARRGGVVLDARLVRRAAKIVEAVRRGGDRALLELARRLDGAVARSARDLVLARRQDDGAAAAAVVDATGELPAGFPEALERAIAAVERFHGPQVRQGYRLASDEGVELEERVLPLGRVGVYVPGGRASYPSTVVMTVVPARLAGVEEIVVATPAAAFRGSAALRHTLRRLGVDEVWGVGGAQAVAALAYGTESLRRVDKIVGPGNAWVTAAKRLVAGEVGIDGLAGPSEVVIVAGDAADEADRAPAKSAASVKSTAGGAKLGAAAGTRAAATPASAALIAADLLAQAEHDPLAVALLITPSRQLARRVAAEVETQLAALERGGSQAGTGAGRDIGAASAARARAALGRFGAALVVGGWEEALELVERLAPEHLQLVGAGAEELAPRVRAAGAVFVGAATPEVFGDYVAGPSHVLPTCGSARFASALGVEDFLRRSHTVRFTPAAAARWAEAAACLAEAEGLPAHAAAARRRLA